MFTSNSFTVPWPVLHFKLLKLGLTVYIPTIMLTAEIKVNTRFRPCDQVVIMFCAKRKDGKSCMVFVDQTLNMLP